MKFFPVLVLKAALVAAVAQVSARHLESVCETGTHERYGVLRYVHNFAPFKLPCPNVGDRVIVSFSVLHSEKAGQLNDGSTLRKMVVAASHNGGGEGILMDVEKIFGVYEEVGCWILEGETLEEVQAHTATHGSTSDDFCLSLNSPNKTCYWSNLSPYNATEREDEVAITVFNTGGCEGDILFEGYVEEETADVPVEDQVVCTAGFAQVCNSDDNVEVEIPDTDAQNGTPTESGCSALATIFVAVPGLLMLFAAIQ